MSTRRRRALAVFLAVASPTIAEGPRSPKGRDGGTTLALHSMDKQCKLLIINRSNKGKIYLYSDPLGAGKHTHSQEIDENPVVTYISISGGPAFVEIPLGKVGEDGTWKDCVATLVFIRQAKEGMLIENNCDKMFKLNLQLSQSNSVYQVAISDMAQSAVAPKKWQWEFADETSSLLIFHVSYEDTDKNWKEAEWVSYIDQVWVFAMSKGAKIKAEFGRTTPRTCETIFSFSFEGDQLPKWMMEKTTCEDFGLKLELRKSDKGDPMDACQAVTIRKAAKTVDPATSSLAALGH